MEAIRTNEFRVSSSEYASLIGRRWLSQWWWAFALPLVATLIVSTADTRFLFVSLMLIFIIWPMALSIAWFNYMFTPRAIRAIRPCIATFDDHAITFEYPIPMTDDSHPTMSKLSPLTFSWSDIKGIEQDGKLMLLFTGNSTKNIADYIAIPVKAIDDNDWQIITEKIAV